jgi:hypothetical protein
MDERIFGSLAVFASLASVHFLNTAFVQVCGDALAFPKSLLGATPKNYLKSPNSEYQVVRAGNSFEVRYGFKGPKGKSMTWQFSVSASAVESELAQHGFPKSIFRPYTPTAEVIAERERVLKAGGFVQEGSLIRPHFREMVRRSRAALATLSAIGDRAGADESVTAAADLYLTFCQDLPYGVPPSEDGDLMSGGILPPLGVLGNGWGDCDSKATLFATLMSYQPNAKLIMVFVPGHQLVGVRGQARSGQDSVQFEGEEYLLCEPVRLAKLPLGKRGPHSSTIEGMRRVLPYND